MPRIIVQTQEGEVNLMAERVSSEDFESHHFTGQLMERIGWAIEDAERLVAVPQR